jgi:hypothetical protein
MRRDLLRRWNGLASEVVSNVDFGSFGRECN